MPNPMRKHSRHRQGIRRGHWKLTVPQTTQCAQCARQIPPHSVCTHCGYYRGRQVITIPVKKPKRGEGKTP